MLPKCALRHHPLCPGITDIHSVRAQGVWEKDEVRKDDSFNTFEVRKVAAMNASPCLHRRVFHAWHRTLHIAQTAPATQACRWRHLHKAALPVVQICNTGLMQA